jgi:hypothetical protein
VFVAAAGPLRADSLSDLKAAVGGLRGSAPIRATVDLQQTEIDRGKKPARTTNGAAAVEASVDAEGLRVAYAPSLVAQVQKEQAARQANGELPAPTARAVAELGPLAIADRLDFGHRLHALLAKSELVSEKRVVLDGRPARLLALKVKNPPVKTSIGHVEILEDNLNVWIGDDNVPVAAQRTERWSGGIMLLKMKIAQSSRWSFVKRDDRLVAVRSEERSTQNGFGQDRDETDIYTVALK